MQLAIIVLVIADLAIYVLFNGNKNNNQLDVITTENTENQIPEISKISEFQDQAITAKYQYKVVPFYSKNFTK